MTNLPQAFLQEMKELLNDEFDDYLKCFDEPYYRALRVNTMKISVEKFKEIFLYELEPVPWSSNSFYFKDENVTKHPFWHAGLYYVQEPSATLPASVLDVKEGERVLDLCAAPGGKSTELAAKLNGTGLLVSNDYSVSRSQILLRNLERFGVKNSFVVSEAPEKLLKYFPGYFDKILVDAPCSGEGMFRKEPHLIDAWIEKDSSQYAPLQKSILASAIGMLKEGGQLVYSTCTFAKVEDEEVIQYALSLDPTLKVVPLPAYEGFVQNEYGTKLFPHKIHGEGHFVTILQKGEKKEADKKSHKKSFTFENMNIEMDHAELTKIKDKVYLIPNTEVDMKGLRVLRSGLLIGEEKKNRLELSGPFALALQDANNSIHFSQADDRVMRYLRGETLQIKDFDVKDGWCLVCINEYPLGFGKVSGGQLKNKYPKAWIYHG